MRLEVLDYTGPTRWRWRLTDAGGGFLADHQVDLDAGAWEFEAFTDLHTYLRWNTVPDRRAEHEAQQVAQVGDWITTRVLGPVADALADARGPVRLEVPAGAAGLGYRPWELARVDGRTLAAHRVTFVVDQQPHRPRKKNGVGERLRMLAVFSLPEGAGALNLRKERHELARMVQRIAKVNNKAVELRVLQYGATRKRLADALLAEPGWDVVHVSGHGLAGGLVLEDDTGRHDLITSTELVDVLDLGGEQIKLVTLSACESAAATATEHLQQLGMAPIDLTPPTRVGVVLPAVAAALVERLDCAVMAMRYPVADDFAIGLAEGFYELLLGRGQPVTRALSLTLPRITASGDVSALSVGTPVLFGPRASDLTLVPPPGGPVVLDEQGAKLAEFPPAPQRFVGRVGPLTRATTALAPDSGRSGVLFHGMAGGGKTACAVELAHTHRGSFGLMAFHTAPGEGQDISSALTDFALALERQIGLALVHRLTDTTTLRAALPALTQAMADNRVLVVLDNIESLLTPAGAWRDERWHLLIDGLCAHQGWSRLVLTSRVRPTHLDAGVLVEPVHALSLREAVLLAREWPHLRALVDATPPPADLTADQARGLAARTLQVVQGHPKLIELADGHARDPAALAVRLREADSTWLAAGTRLDAFVNQGESAATAQDFLAVLQGWTRATTATLPTSSAVLFRLLCCLEEPDRVRGVVEEVWPRLWQHLHSTDPPVEPPGLDAALVALVEQALVATAADPETGLAQVFRVHPGVAETGRATTSPDQAAVVDRLAGDFWLGLLRGAFEREQDRQLGWLVVRAARGAGPYLLRLHRWNDLGAASDQLLYRDTSKAAAAAVLPLLAAAVDATRDTPDELALGRTHARALTRLNPAEGEARLRDLLQTAATRDQPATVSNLTADLINLCRDSGRLDEALTLADTQAGYTRRAGLGPWTQLLDHSQRLQILYAQGRYRQVLDEVRALRETWAALPDPPEANDTAAIPWNVRETLLNLGCRAARDLQLWGQALELNAENLDSLGRRGASDAERARALFNDYGPLLGLGRAPEARDLLHHCRAAFQADNDVPNLGRTLGALAGVEEALGHRDLSISLATDALRYTYLAGDPSDIGISHYNLAGYLHRDGQDSRSVWAHRLAAAVIHYHTGYGLLASTLRAIAALSGSDPDSRPTSLDQVIDVVEQVEGVHLSALLDRLPPRAPDNQTALTTVLDLASQAADQAQAEHTAQLVAQWDPVLAALHTALRHPDPDTRQAATTVLDQTLTMVEQKPEWRDLAGVLRRLHTGAHDAATDDPAALLAGLDDINATIARRALDLLIGTHDHGIDPDAWRTTPDNDNGDDGGWEAFAAAVAAAAAGDATARAQIDPTLHEMAGDPDWAPLATALRRLIDGDGDPATVDGLTPDHTTVLDAVRARLGPPPPAADPTSEQE